MFGFRVSFFDRERAFLVVAFFGFLLLSCAERETPASNNQKITRQALIGDTAVALFGFRHSFDNTQLFLPFSFKDNGDDDTTTTNARARGCLSFWPLFSTGRDTPPPLCDYIR